jgi:hypothetical protein
MGVKPAGKMPVKKKSPIKKSSSKAGVKKVATANGGLEKVIIAMRENVDRIGENIDRLGEKIDRTASLVNESLTVMTERMVASKVETDAKIAASDAKIAASLASMTASKMETDAKIAASFDRLDRVVEKTKAQLAGLSDSSGRAVESLAYSFFDSRMTFAGVKFDDMEVGVNRRRKLPDGTRIQGEYDIVLYNGSAIALIEAKNRVRRGDVTKLIDEQLPRFKLFFPQYKDFKFYLGLCGMSFEDGVEKEALDMGIGTLKPNGDAVEINETTVRAW